MNKGNLESIIVSGALGAGLYPDPVGDSLENYLQLYGLTPVVKRAGKPRKGRDNQLFDIFSPSGEMVAIKTAQTVRHQADLFTGNRSALIGALFAIATGAPLHLFVFEQVESTNSARALFVDIAPLIREHGIGDNSPIRWREATRISGATDSAKGRNLRAARIRAAELNGGWPVEHGGKLCLAPDKIQYWILSIDLRAIPADRWVPVNGTDGAVRHLISSLYNG